MISLSDILVMLEVGEIGYPEPNSYQAPVHISQFINPDNVPEITHRVSILQIIVRIVTLILHPGDFF